MKNLIQKYIDLEDYIITKYKINLVKESKCRSRTHAHCDGTRRICKYKKVNSVQSLFTLAHEIGHIMTKTSKMRRCESEYYATVWALQELARLNVEVPESIIQSYQDYIYQELDRGLRRQGGNYLPREEMDLHNALNVELKVKRVPADRVIRKHIEKKEAKLGRKIL